MSTNRNLSTLGGTKVSWPLWTGWCLLIAYAVAMFLPAMNATPSIGGGMDAKDTLWGWEAFLFSFLLIHIPVWLANPLFAFGVFSIFRGGARAAAIAGGMATLLAVFWPASGMLARRPIPCLQLGNFGTGYWLWLSCMVTLLCAGIFRHLSATAETYDSPQFVTHAGSSDQVRGR